MYSSYVLQYSCIVYIVCICIHHMYCSIVAGELPHPQTSGLSVNLLFTICASQRGNARKAFSVGKFGLREVFFVGKLGLAPPKISLIYAPV